MEIDNGVRTAQGDRQAAAKDAREELAAENARLRRLVGELLLKNQRLREGVSSERVG
jgi:hypothetical protein